MQQGIPDWARAFANEVPAVLERPDPCIRVSIQGLEMASYRHRPVRLTGWQGWTEGPDQRGGPVSHETADGGIQGQVYADGREITLEGSVIVGTHAELEEHLDALRAVLRGQRWDWLRVEERHLGVERMVSVARLARPLINRTGPTSAVFTLRLAAAGSRLLDQAASLVTLRDGETRELVNVGDAPADLSAMIYGPFTGDVTLSWPGGAWTLKGGLPDGARRAVDFPRRIVRDPATSVLWRLSASGAWPSLPPGRTEFTVTGAGGGHIDIGWRSSWH